MQRANIRMVQRGNGLCLPLEALAELRGGNLDRNIALQAGIMRLVHLSHAAFTDRRNNFIGAQCAAGRDRHLGVSLADHNMVRSCVTAHPLAILV